MLCFCFVFLGLVSPRLPVSLGCFCFVFLGLVSPVSLGCFCFVFLVRVLPVSLGCFCFVFLGLVSNIYFMLSRTTGATSVEVIVYPPENV